MKNYGISNFIQMTYGRIISMSYIENMDKRTKLRTLRNAMDELSRRTVHI
jgi:hypothetical protein